MSALHTNRNIQTVLLGDSLIQGLSDKQLFTTGPITLKQKHQMILQMVCYVPPLQSKKGTVLQTYTSPDFYSVTSEKST